MSRPSTLPVALPPSEFSTEILKLYASGLSVVKVAKHLRETLPPNQFVRAHEIAAFLKEQNIFRTRSETMKYVSDTLEYVNECSVCHERFKAHRYNHKYCKKCVPNAKAWGYAKRFKISQNQFDDLLQAQNFACCLCQEKFDNIKPHRNKTSSIVVDHDHTTNIVRGLLCNECNITLGRLEKRPDNWLIIALKYTKKVLSDV